MLKATVKWAGKTRKGVPCSSGAVGDVDLMVAENVEDLADNEHDVEKVHGEFDGGAFTGENVQL